MNINRDDVLVKNIPSIGARTGSLTWSDIYDADTNPLNVNVKHRYQFVIFRNRPSKSELQSVEMIAAAGNATHISDFSATCGIKTSDVLLSWKSEREYTATYTDRFRLERRQYSSTDGKFEAVPGAEDIASATINNTFTDKTCAPGVMYEYRLMLWNDNAWTDAGRTAGYIISTGSVAGRITYGNGLGEASDVAAAGTEVVLTPLSVKNTSQQAFPLRCRLIETRNDTIKVPLTETDQNQLERGYTLSYWKKDKTTQNEWRHYTYTGYGNGQDSLFLSDRESIQSSEKVSAQNFSQGLIFLGDSTSYDEIQLWNRPLDRTDIMTYSLRHLSGEEDGLVAYLPMDEPFNYGFCADMAMNGSQSRGHHAILTSSVKVSNLSAPIGFNTYTDAKGNYSIKGLPFGEGGEDIIYRVQPIYGAHVFTPATQNVLMTSSSRAFTQRDFTDETSVNISGKVSYHYGNYPVEGAEILVDGQTVSRSVTNSGVTTYETVKTDVEGKYGLVVASGEHKISVRLDGHTFTQAEKTIPGTANVKDLDFDDNTLMRIYGRVAGGSYECSKKLPSYRAANANIGQATLYLRPTNNRAYTINTTGKDVAMTRGDDKIYDATTLRAYNPLSSKDQTIVITTDSTTGEFCAMLPPISYTITGGFTESVPNDSLRAFDMPEITPTLREDGQFTDTCIVRYESQPYFILKDASYPDFLVMGKDSITVDGKKFALFKIFRDSESPNMFTDSIHYALGHPVWESGTRQSLMVHLIQSFYNAARRQWTEQSLPEGTKISFVSCNISDKDDDESNTITLGKDGWGTYSFTVREPSRDTNSYYALQASYRLNNRNYTYPDEPMEMIIIGDNVSEGSGYITTGPDQIDFVLHRPPGTNSSATLHSGSVIVSQSSVTNTDNHSNAVRHNFTATPLGLTWNVGGFKTYFKAQEKTNLSSTSSSTLTTSKSSFNITSLGEDISTSAGTAFVGANGNIFVGHATSKLFGRCYKFGFVSSLPASPITQSVVLENEKGDKCYLVGYEGSTRGFAPDHSVKFAYTRYHIENDLIPNIRKFRDQMILAPGTVPTFNDTVKAKYVSLVPVKDPKFGTETNYEVKYAPGATHEDSLINEVYDCNCWIDSWTQTLANDERDCLAADCKNVQTISSGAQYSKAITSDRTNTSVYLTGYAFTNSQSNGFTISFDATHDEAADSKAEVKEFFNKIKNAISEGFNAAKSKLGDLFHHNAGGGSGGNNFIAEARRNVPGMTQFTGGINTDLTWIDTDIDKFAQSRDTTTTASTKVSYTIQDNDAHDYLTVGISDRNDAGAIYYRIQGGATTNPWEGGEKTKYYMAGTTLSNPTLKVQKPVISLEKSVLTDVPSGHSTTLALNITNGSEINVSQYYNVSMFASSNPDGLIVEMDGRPLAQGAIPVWVDAGKTVTKILTVRQSRQDVMDYENVKLSVAGQSLQTFELSNTTLSPVAPFSVHFKPSCSDITLSITDTLGHSINTINQVTGDTVRLTVSDYDLTYKGFEKIQLQRYDRSLQRWQPIHQWYLDSSVARQFDADSVCRRPTLHYDYNMHQMADDTYRLRAVTIGRYGTVETQYEAPEQTLIKDVTPPRLLGATSPVSGTLTPEGEISVTFNEDISKDRIVDANIIVTGQLNSEKLLHDTGLEFHGADPVLSSVPLTITREGSSVEMWLQRETGKAGTVFAHGTNNSRFAFGYDEDDHLWVTVGRRKYTSQTQIKAKEWQFLHVGFAGGKVSACCLWNDGGTARSEWVLQPDTTFYYNTRAICRFGENFYGRISQITLWNSPRTDITEISATKDLPHAASEKGLQNYWPCSECHGTLAADRVAERSLSLPSENNWYISQQNHSVYFDGRDSLVYMPQVLNLGNLSDYAVEMWINPDQGSPSAQELITTSVGGLSLQDGVPALGGYKVAAKDLRDGRWHHFAMSVLYGKSITFMVDGSVTRTFDSDTIRNYLAARGIPFDYNPDKYVVGKNYKGYMDEIRVWTSTLSQSVLREGMYKRMTGTEKGLALLSNMEDASVFDGIHIRQSEVSPSLQPTRIEQSVRHTWVASDRKIVITPTELPSTIEGCTLHITVDKISDVHGNDIHSPITWAAYVNRSTLLLSENVFDMITREGYQVQDNITVTNTGSTSDVITFSNVPSWLLLSDVDFTLDPLKSEYITMTVPDDIPTGNYTATMLVTSKATGISQSVVVTLTVGGVTPIWNVDTDSYNSSCNILATCRHGSNLSENEYDMLVAYVNDDDGTPIYLGKARNTYLSGIRDYRFLLNVYFDAESATSGYKGNLTMKKDRTIHYLYWSNDAGVIYTDVRLYDASGNPVSLTLDNMENFRVYGTPLAPCEFQAQNSIQQTLTYGKGWNWISLNTRTEDESIEDYFPTDGNLQTVKTQTCSAQFNGKKWIGDLPDQVDQPFRNMYLVQANSTHSHIYEGTPLTPSKTSFQIKQGWNWIPYYPTMRMPIGYALRDVAFVGDVVKGQDGFAYRTSSGWVGTLSHLTPGHGYMYCATENVNFSYPDNYIATYEARQKVDNDVDNDVDDDVDTGAEYQYPMNMCAIIAPEDADSQPLCVGTITAYDPQGNLRGTAAVGNPISQDGATDMAANVSFMTISGDASTDIHLWFKSTDGTLYQSDSTLPYVSNTMLGTPEEPLQVRFHVADATAISSLFGNDGTGASSFDLTGRRATDATRGVVITNGEKTVNRNK